jgi:uncharacterized phage protein (TIGR02218 family)
VDDGQRRFDEAGVRCLAGGGLTVAFGFFEMSRFRGRPVTLLTLTLSDTVTLTFTDADKDITRAGVVYLSTPFQVPSIRTSNSTDTADITIKVPANSTIAEQFLYFPPSRVVEVVLQRGHLNDPDQDFIVVWSGRVLAVTRRMTIMEIKAGSMLSSMKRVGLGRMYQRHCPWPVYSAHCHADRASKQAQPTLNAVSTATITVNSGSLPLAGERYLGGEVEWVHAGLKEIRTVIAVPDDDTFVLSGPTRGLVPGSTVTMWAGCRRTIEDCDTFHNNKLNFGGQPGLPLKNIVNKNRFW